MPGFSQKDLQMDHQAVHNPDQFAASYLQQLQALAFEISVAMDAIAANALSNFQDSVAKQEMLCSVLAAMGNTLREQVDSPEQPWLLLGNAAVEQRIRATTRTICKLNLQYAALLRHSGRSIALLLSLCKSHTSQFQEAHGLGSKRQTWSCEM